MPREILDFGRTMDAASLRYAAATDGYESLQLEFNISCRLRSEIADPRGRVFAFRFAGCRGICVLCREWGGAGWRVAKHEELPLIEALHADALKPLTVDYFLMKSAAELADVKPHLAGGRWVRGAFERFEAAVDRGALCFWMKAGGAGPSNAPLDCRIVLACDDYRIFGFDGEVRPDEFVAIGRRWWTAWRDYWDRRKRGEAARDAEFEWTQPYVE